MTGATVAAGFLVVLLPSWLAGGGVPPRGAPEGPAAREARVVYVDADRAEGPQDGRSWATAYRSLQRALRAARAGAQIWVAAGTHKPTATNDRTVSFQLRPGVALYGGFAGTETRRDQRDWAKNLTTLSGDIGRPGDPRDNSYHVVRGADDAILDGFTIAHGQGGRPRGRRPRQPVARPGPWPGIGPPPFRRPQPGIGPRRARGPGGQVHVTPQIVMSGPQPGQGGGMINYQCAPIVRNCIFRNNRAFKGGAMYNMAIRAFGPPHGPADPAPTVINCTFLRNYAVGRGGAVSNDLRTHPTFIHCTFIGNSTDDKGGAIYNDFACSPTVTHCLFVGNSAFRAAAMGNDGGSCPVITCCTFTRNKAKDSGAALYQGTGPANNPLVTNCILWGNICEVGPAEIANWHDCQPKVTGSCVQGGYVGKGNIDADPRFDDPDKGDFRLAADSPCPTAGHTAAAPEITAQRPSPPPRRPMRVQEERPPSRLPAQAVVYVVASNTGGRQDGKAWATAYASLQQGIDHAWRCGAEVWVAKGTYAPAAGADRSASFRLRPGVAVYGGFAGTETLRSQRDVKSNPTILSGDIGKPADASDNSYHVLVGANRATIDGFTIMGGNADGQAYDGKGGGMVNYRGVRQPGPFGPVIGLSPTVTHCIFRDNHAIEGGAIYNFDRCAPRLARCTFMANSAHNGGAVVDRVGVNTVMTHCTFRGNRAKWRGGALYIDYGSRPEITGCTFIGNTTGGHGGAVYMLTRASQLEHSAPSFANCTFTANRARLRGGAIANFDRCLLQVAGCTFSRNHAGKGGGAIANDFRTHATLARCTFIGNSAGEGRADVDCDDTSQVKVSR